MSDMTRSGHRQFIEAGERKYQEQKKTPTVKTIQDTGDTAALLVLDDGSKPIWTPDRDLARTLLGKPIPADWLIKPNKQGTGNIALPPKKGGGGGGYRQSKEAFESEAKSRAAWQQIEEEKKDRRTALMQAREGFGERWPAFVDRDVRMAQIVPGRRTSRCDGRRSDHGGAPSHSSPSRGHYVGGR